MIPQKIQNDFYEGRTNSTVKFAINDSVEVVDGEFKGKKCAVISIQTVEPEVVLMIERGDNGALISVPQASLVSLQV